MFVLRQVGALTFSAAGTRYGAKLAENGSRVHCGVMRGSRGHHAMTRGPGKNGTNVEGKRYEVRGKGQVKFELSRDNESGERG